MVSLPVECMMLQRRLFRCSSITLTFSFSWITASSKRCFHNQTNQRRFLQYILTLSISTSVACDGIFGLSNFIFFQLYTLQPVSEPIKISFYIRHFGNQNAIVRTIIWETYEW